MRPDYIEAGRQYGMNPDRGNQQIALNKAGECLKYAIGNELHVNNHSIPNHLMAFVVFFILKGKIERNSAGWFRDVLRRREYGESDFKTFYRQLSGFIVRNLKKHYQFNDSDSLFSILDQITIPDWAFAASEKMLYLLPDLYLVNERLYYITERHGGYYFRSVHVRDADAILDFDEQICTDCNETNRTISRKYSGIIGFNAETNTFYLRLKNMDKMFSIYDVDNDYETIVHYQCFGLLVNTFPLIRDGNNLAVVVNGKRNAIREIDAFEEYSTDREYIRVEPATGMPAFFKPYKLMVDGETEEYSYDEQAAFLEGKIREQLDGDVHELPCRLTRIGDSEAEVKARRKGKFFTPAYIDGLLDKYHMEENRTARMYHIINRYLKKYLSEESDVLDYYYMFADVSRKLAHETGSDSITEVLYRRLNEVVVRGKLEKAVQKVDTLRELLLESVSLNGEKQPKKGNKLKEGRSTVGCFEFDSEGNIYGMNETGDEVVIGNNLMKRDMNLQGVIAYNMEYGIYEIRYPRMMNETEKRTVIKCFLQEGDSYRFYADCKVLPEAAP